MDRNSYIKKSDMINKENQKGEVFSTPISQNKSNRNNDDLIIDDTSVYEIDQECYERAKRAKINHKS